jgi:hypothetical protein
VHRQRNPTRDAVVRFDIESPAEEPSECCEISGGGVTHDQLPRMVQIETRFTETVQPAGCQDEAVDIFGFGEKGSNVEDGATHWDNRADLFPWSVSLRSSLYSKTTSYPGRVRVMAHERFWCSVGEPPLFLPEFLNSNVFPSSTMQPLVLLQYHFNDWRPILKLLDVV